MDRRRAIEFTSAASLATGAGATRCGSPDAYLFRIEGRLLKDALERFRSKAEPLAPVSITLFGSRARGDAREGSDLDLLVVVPERGVEAEGRVREASVRISESPGLRVAPLFLSVRECRTARGGTRALLRAVAKEGKTVHGRPLEDFFRA